MVPGQQLSTVTRGKLSWCPEEEFCSFYRLLTKLHAEIRKKTEQRFTYTMMPVEVHFLKSATTIS